MNRYLPRTNSRLLAVATLLIAVFYAVLAAGFALNLMRQPVGLVLAPLFALLAWGMWTLSRFARWVTIIWLWILVLALPLGVFTLIVQPQSPDNPPFVASLLAGVTPLVALGIFFIYVLGKHKREFKWP
jgi:hypothetical protein